MVGIRFATGSPSLTFRLELASRQGLRFEMGNLGDHKSVGGGVWEARLAFGPGYRIYFGKDGPSIILLLLGGGKASQTKDIRQAQGFWIKYREVTQHGKTQQGLE